MSIYSYIKFWTIQLAKDVWLDRYYEIEKRLMKTLFIVGRIQMVKADKARAVEDLLIRMAQSNQLRAKVTEKQLIDLLGQISQQDSSSNQTRIVVSLYFNLDVLQEIGRAHV